MDYRGLMVGDWLLDKEEGLPRRVAQVTSDVFGGCAPGVILENGMDYQECEPIPLTAEILMKNNKYFSKTPLMGEQQHYTYYLGPSLSLLAIYDADFSFQIGSSARKIKYVHELQHILRLCNMNEKADNLIIDSYYGKEKE